jgi:hypothetical protein
VIIIKKSSGYITSKIATVSEELESTTRRWSNSYCKWKLEKDDLSTKIIVSDYVSILLVYFSCTS